MKLLRFIQFNIFKITAILILLSAVPMIYEVACNGAESFNDFTWIGIIGEILFFIGLALIPMYFLITWIIGWFK